MLSEEISNRNGLHGIYQGLLLSSKYIIPWSHNKKCLSFHGPSCRGTAVSTLSVSASLSLGPFLPEAVLIKTFKVRVHIGLGGFLGGCGKGLISGGFFAQSDPAAY